MSDMAYEIHLFTRGEGPLKTTQDLFQRAEVFLQHGVLLYGIIKEFLAQVPNGYLKDELVLLLKKVPYNFFNEDKSPFGLYATDQSNMNETA